MAGNEDSFAGPRHGQGPAGQARRDEPTRGTPAWRREVSRWISASLQVEEARAVGEVTEYLSQPWSSVWTVATTRGTFWFKENKPSHGSECRLHAVLGDLAPEYVEAPVAVDRERRWMLTRDGGAIVQTLDVEPLGVPPRTLVGMVRDYAHLQRLTVSQRDYLISVGLSELPPADAAVTARRFAEHLAGLSSDDPRRISPEQLGEILGAIPALQEAAEALAAGPVPCTLDQGDFLPTNTFLPRAGAAHRVFDFADAAWTHPFCSMVMIAKEYLRRRVDPPPSAVFDLRPERIKIVLDAYLDEWSDVAPPDVLRELLRDALRIAPLLRSLAWYRTLSDFDFETLRSYGLDSWWWLQRLTVPVIV
jgi:hypothetical protein